MKLKTARRSFGELGNLWAGTTRTLGSAAKKEDGVAIVEMALASIVLFAFLFGIIFIGWALYAYDFISDAAREGARYAIVRGAQCSGLTNCPDATSDQIQTYVRGITYPGLTASNITVAAEWYTVTHPGGGTASITDCGNAPTTVPTGSTLPCDYPGNIVQITATYSFPINIFRWKSTSISMQSRSELVISQ